MDIRVPAVGESVFEALVAKWLKGDGERVARDEQLCELETDKITFEIAAERDGILRIRVSEGTTVKIGSVIGVIEEEAAGERKQVAGTAKPEVREPGIVAAEPVRHVSPSERKARREKGEGEALHPAEAPPTVRSEEPATYRAGQTGGEERETRTPMTPIRRRIAERLMAARQQTAMLTTFNEADMSRVLALRAGHKDEFQRKHGVPLGFMPFFVKACCEALVEFPAVNARIDGDAIVYQHFYDIGIAVSGDKGLVVPVLRDADRMRFADVEQRIADFVDRIRHNRLAISDLEGGTFTITNGGVFGSLMSTPILNPPQSGVLGMHAIQERPVARDGQVVIRPMMYLALSYDHRIIDGREAVQFLKKVKEFIEEPGEMLLEG